MKKKLLSIGLLAIGYAAQAQNVLLHVDDTATMYVSEGTLVYNGGGLQSRGSGVIDLHGNMMVVGTATDSFITIPTNGTSGSSNTPEPTNVILRINQPNTPTATTYGQLYIKGIPQGNLNGSVDKEYANVKHGAYQQIGIPFMNKTFKSLSTDLGGGTSVFDAVRWGGKEILKWSNTNMRFDGSIIPNAPISSASTPGIAIDFMTNSTLATTSADRAAYYTVGTGGSSTTGYNPVNLRTVKGRPYADGITGVGNTINLTPSTVNYGVAGNGQNIYYERYNTYIGDPFNGLGFYAASFAKNLYQFSNPYFTNLDLSLIGYDEPVAVTDNNNLSNILGIAVDPQNVTWNSNTGGAATYLESQKVTFDPVSRKPTGAYSALIIKPLSTFKIKLRDNTSQTLDFDNLRRFSSIPRIETVSYSVTAAKNTNVGAIKQLGVLALDAAGNQIGETYYVVAPQFTTGSFIDPSINSVQAVTSTMNAVIQTYEEVATGGIDPNSSSAYRLYINEANESNYLGKRIDLSIFGQNVASLKFEVRDDTVLIPNNTHTLSSGTGFYYTVGNGQAAQVLQGATIPVSSANFGLYYGNPQTQGSLNTSDSVKKSRTLVVYNPEIDNYIVRFDSDWKSASVEVFDSSGKLVISEKSVKTNSDFVIKLDSSLKALYIVKVVGDDGTLVNSKILIK